jgi:probable DNA repair protein
MISTLFKHIDDATTVLTPNRRLSATLLKKYNQVQIEQGKTCWPSLAILPLASWIQTLWQYYLAEQQDTAPLLLTAQQELVLWEDILQKFPVNETLLQLSATAELARSAWGILKQWQVDLAHPTLKATEDSQAFILWATHFQNTCQKNHWLDTNSLIKLIQEKILAEDITLPKRLITIGFTEYSPLQQQLFSACKQMGVEVIHYTEAISDTLLAQRISFEDEETEIYALARWAKSLYDSNPHSTIGCIVPNLEQIRDHVLPIFSGVFNTGQINLNPLSQSFNITAGKSLANYPIIHAAFQLLGLYEKTLTIEDMSSLLLSPFLGDAEHEQVKRAQCDVYLRKSNLLHTTLKELIDPSLKINLLHRCPQLAKRIDSFIALIQQQPAMRPISEWVSVFMELLSILGWPGERSINSQEYQVVQRWLELLTEYQTFDNLLPAKTYTYALHYLMRLTSSIIFQPQGPETSVQVLGILEATGLPFDYTWIMGFDDSAWPPPAKPNPFIPHSLQATLGMPHATAEREFEYSRRLVEQLKQSTKNIIFSHAKHNGDCELRISPLVQDLPEIENKQLSLSHFISLAEESRQSQQLETITDSQASPLSNTTLHGGATIFKLQAACPFKAFAEMRLKAQPIESPSLGLRPQDRGKITHKALELFWQEVKDSEKLHAYSEVELKNLLDKAIIHAIQVVTSNKAITSRYLSLEIARLQCVLWDWLQIEKARPPFKVIAQEEEHSVNIAGLSLSLRIDRVDELCDGSRLIIDYKTSNHNHIRYWFGERLDEPQLPLYCVTTTTVPIGITFAEINPASLAMKGVSKIDTAIDGIKLIAETPYCENRQWEEQTHAWQKDLERLGRDFTLGKAEVDPKNIDETCEHCDLHTLCRVTG